DRYARPPAGARVGVDRLDSGGPVGLGQDLLRPAADQDVGPFLVGVQQPRLVVRALAPGRVAVAHVAGSLRRVLLGVGVADHRPAPPAETLGAQLHLLLRGAEIADLVGRA